jgi:hypothetical protein
MPGHVAGDVGALGRSRPILTMAIRAVRGVPDPTTFEVAGKLRRNGLHTRGLAPSTGVACGLRRVSRWVSRGLGLPIAGEQGHQGRKHRAAITCPLRRRRVGPEAPRGKPMASSDPYERVGRHGNCLSRMQRRRLSE